MRSNQIDVLVNMGVVVTIVALAIGRTVRSLTGMDSRPRGASPTGSHEVIEQRVG